MKIDTQTIDHFRIGPDGEVYFGLRQLAYVAELPLKTVFWWWKEQLGWGNRDEKGAVVLEIMDFSTLLLMLKLRNLDLSDEYIVALGERIRESSLLESNPIFWYSSEGGAELMGYTEFTRRIHLVDQAFVFDFEEVAHQLYEVVKQHITKRELNVPQPKRPRTTKLANSISA